MKILVTGRDGQVGYELTQRLGSDAGVTATGRADLDLADADAVRRVVRETRPEVILNAAAYTAVDKAEAEPEVAMRVNGTAPGVLAAEARRLGALLVHYSTDYVFDGEKASPYVEEDATNPINVYGRTKLEGERAVLGVGCRYLILRTSWVYGPRGRNFLLTILRRASKGERLRVVGDQHGRPTSSGLLAEVTLRCLQRGAEGLYHVAGSGATTWFEFARAIVGAKGLAAGVDEIPSSEYPTPARRPRNSVLDTLKLERTLEWTLPGWRDGLRTLVAQAQIQA